MDKNLVYISVEDREDELEIKWVVRWKSDGEEIDLFGEQLEALDLAERINNTTVEITRS